MQQKSITIEDLEDQKLSLKHLYNDKHNLYSILKIIGKLHWLHSALEDQQVAPPT